MRTVSVTEFKAKCLRFFDEVEAGETISVTRRGKPIGVFVPAPPENYDPSPGRCADTVVTVGDVLSPIDVEWNALQ